MNTSRNTSGNTQTSSERPESVQGWSITDVAAWCAQVAAESTVLFEWCGQQVTATDEGGIARWWASATHRHGWHIELALDRLPTIPLVDATTLADDALASARGQRTTGAGLDITKARTIQDWRAQVAPLRDLLAAAVSTGDPLLDPATARVAELVGHDLDELAALTPSTPDVESPALPDSSR